MTNRGKVFYDGRLTKRGPIGKSLLLVGMRQVSIAVHVRFGHPAHVVTVAYVTHTHTWPLHTTLHYSTGLWCGEICQCQCHRLIESGQFIKWKYSSTPVSTPSLHLFCNTPHCRNILPPLNHFSCSLIIY